ncbi:hypothetical protein RZV17_07670 [Xanthomonas cannabis]|uniref:hypothetical protein n=1 Tax=Xanthomonas cannabis TaxID=1885674 RepID=UPI0033A960DF
MRTLIRPSGTFSRWEKEDRFSAAFWQCRGHDCVIDRELRMPCRLALIRPSGTFSRWEKE